MAAPFFQALLRNLPLIISSAQGLYKLWTEVQGTKQEDDKVIKAMQLLRNHQDDIDRFLEDPERQRVLMEGYSILVRRLQTLERRRAYGEPGHYPPSRRYEDNGFDPCRTPSFHDRDNDYAGKKDNRSDFTRQGDYGWRNSYREQNRYQDGDYRDHYSERCGYWGRQEEDYGDRYRERNGCRRRENEERQLESYWKKTKTNADCDNREKVEKFSKVKAHLLCDVCTELYDSDYHRPMLLPTCGHTFCRNCLRTISRQRHLRCPVCRSDPFMDVSSLPTNMPILSLITEENGASGENHEGVRGARCAPSAPCRDALEENNCTIDTYGAEIMSLEEQLQYALMLSSELQEADRNNSNPFAFLDKVNHRSIDILEDEQIQLAMAMSLEEHQVAQEDDTPRHTWAGRTEEQQQQTRNPSFGSGRERGDWWQLEREREEVRKEKERLKKEREEWKRQVEKENRERARQTIRNLTKCLESDDCCVDDSDDEYCKEEECCSDVEDCKEEECYSENEDCFEKECCSEEEEEEEKGCCSKSNNNPSEDTEDTVIGATGVDPACSVTDEVRLLAIVLEEEKKERRMRREKKRRMKFEEDIQLATALSLSLQDDPPAQE